MDWMTSVKSVKAALAKQKFVYSQTRYSTIKIGTLSESVRHDCSGYVSACLYFFGAFKKNQMTTSWGFAKDSDIAKQLKAAGFTKMDWPGWSSLKEGDIITQPNAHVEIFSHNLNGKHYVYSNGKTSDCQSAVATPDGGRHRYTVAWRLNGNNSSAKIEKYTKTAFIKDVQRIFGATVNGKVSKTLLNKTITVSEKKNSTHQIVRCLQKYFKEVLGYEEIGAIDGEAGPKFTAVVKKYQKDVVKGEVDGEITAKEKTWSKLLGLS